MRRFVSAFLASTALLACSPGDEAVRKIAFVQDLGAPDAEEHAQPALQAAELAVATQAPEGVSVELVTFDLAEEPSAIEEITSDPAFVAAIVGPGADGSELAEAGVPVVSVSTAGPTPSGGTWRRFVALMDAVAGTIVEELVGSETCVLSEEPPPDGLADLLSERLGGAVATPDPAEASSFVQQERCDAVAWAGSPDPGAELARALAPAIGLVGGDRLLDPDFLDAGSAADGARAVCACADLSTSIDPASTRFIQDYQSEFGTAPGAYAVESWDATGAILAALGSGSDRDEIAASIEGLDLLEGLATTYRFGVTGELKEGARAVTVSDLRSGRWIPRPAT
jgi:branched-chain amino acid transport system substrate-binding protein